ncbi:microcystin-dependent protein [Runella defluvii]|uniref:Microcystin-dependent protein n=1 Tax=Runella defluvii TaxID=370973 RepID=A0A7W5ZQ48_9BACT|nr:tail fiber protein [Runella defluvii]MBB3841578.1 microcystin-dependent protein [Runella defluvii]
MARKGQVALFVGKFIPKDWALCNGKNGTPNIPDTVYDKYGNTIRYLVATQDHEDYYIGFIYPTVIDYAPIGWELCDGKIMNIQDNLYLYSLLSETYNGDSRNTFYLPKIGKFKSDNKTYSGDNFIHYMICVDGIYPRLG